MKVAVILLAVAVVGAFAEDSAIPEFKCTSTNSFVCTFQELGHKIKHHAKALGNKLAPVGNAILQSAIEQGKNLLGNTAQALAGTILNHFGSDGSLGKRDTAFLDKVKAHVANGFAKLKQMKEGLHAAFKKAYTKLTGIMADNSMLKNLDENTDKKIDAAVEEFKQSGKKGFFAMAKTISGKIRDIFQAGMDKLRERFGKKMEARAVWWDNLKSKWQSATQAISDTFKPHLDTLTKGIKDLADKAKEHGNKLVGAAKDSFDNLKTQLSGHVDTLKKHAATLGDHGKAALDTIKAALAEVASKAGGDIKDALSDVLTKTLTGGVGY